MKWSIYKRMSKEHKEEYNHKFSKDHPLITTFLTVALIAAIMGQGGAAIFLVVMTFLVAILEDKKEKAWLKKRDYIEQDD